MDLFFPPICFQSFLGIITHSLKCQMPPLSWLQDTRGLSFVCHSPSMSITDLRHSSIQQEVICPMMKPVMGEKRHQTSQGSILLFACMYQWLITFKIHQRKQQKFLTPEIVSSQWQILQTKSIWPKLTNRITDLDQITTVRDFISQKGLHYSRINLGCEGHFTLYYFRCLKTTRDPVSLNICWAHKKSCLAVNFKAFPSFPRKKKHRVC